MTKIKSFKIYTDDTDENKVLVGNDINTALEILENNGYIIEAEYEQKEKTIIQINLKKDSSFNDKNHFIYCLQDLINEWEDVIGAKEMDKEDAGFNCERLSELKTILNGGLTNDKS